MNNDLSDYNIILVNLDGLRQDKVEFCDNLNLLKEKSIYFPNMITASPYTLASHYSIITGLYPSQHGVDSYYHMFKFKKNLITMPELLKRANYFTRCDIQLDTLMTKKGFDEYNVFDEHTVDYKTRHRNILKEISKHDKFFLFLQYSKLHTYLVSEVMSKTDKDSNDDEYFQNVQKNESRFVSHLKECDDAIGNIMCTLDDLKLLDKTIVIVTADHGTSFGEKKGEKFYGTFVYDYTIKVFCMMYIPNETSQIVQNQCSSIDIFPTVAEIAGLNLGNDCSDVLGKSLFNFINSSENTDREVFVETGGLHGPWPSPKRHNVFCVRKNNKKLIYNDTPKTWEFYDLKNDPKELNNIYDDNSQDITKFKNILLDYLKTLEIKTKLTPDMV